MTDRLDTLTKPKRRHSRALPIIDGHVPATLFAEEKGLAMATVVRHIKAGYIKGKKLNRRWYIDPDKAHYTD